MYIKSVYLENFRNYTKQNVELEHGINVFYGDNAQGKTNFIESIFIASMGKSFKFINEKDLILFTEKRAEICIDFYSFGLNQNTTVIFNEDRQKIIKSNGIHIKKRMELIGKLNVVLFTPGELNIIREGPGLRRKFIDMCAGQLRCKYLYAISNYNKVLEQKNKLLKSIKNNVSLKDTIYIWNEKMADYGSIVLWYRQSLINRIKNMIKPIYYEITEEKENLSIAYVKTFNFDESSNIEEIRDKFIYNLNKNLDKEIETSSCITGPHRDDLIFYINGKSVKPFASQGQQRSIVLALKLVQTELFYEETGEQPVLLLDDITSELDINRRTYLFNKIKDRQVIITCTDAEKIAVSDKTVYFNVKNGCITKDN